MKTFQHQIVAQIFKTSEQWQHLFFSITTDQLGRQWVTVTLITPDSEWWRIYGQILVFIRMKANNQVENSEYTRHRSTHQNVGWTTRKEVKTVISFNTAPWWQHKATAAKCGFLQSSAKPTQIYRLTMHCYSVQFIFFIYHQVTKTVASIHFI